MRETDSIKGMIKRQTIPNLWMWHSDDRFLLQEGLEILLKYYSEIDPSGSNVERLSAKQYPPRDIIDRANAGSFFPNLLIIDDVPYFQDSQLDLEPLYDYIKNPNPRTCLLFFVENIHKGRKLYKEMSKLGAVMEFAVPRRRSEWQEWINGEAKKRGKVINPGASAFLLDWAGHHPGVLSQEMDKLILAIGPRSEISVEDIRINVTRTIEASIFDLLDALAKQISSKAVDTLREILRQEHPLKVLTLITRQMRLLLGVQAAQEKRLTEDEAGTILGIKPYELQKVWQQARLFPENILVSGLKECLQIERAIKTGRGEALHLLEFFIIKFCGQKG